MTEADEVAELKKMFRSPAKGKGTIPINRRPAWDDTPLRHRPPALLGLKPVTREPWAVDEDVYNRRFETRDVGVRAWNGSWNRVTGRASLAHALRCVYFLCVCSGSLPRQDSTQQADGIELHRLHVPIRQQVR